MIELLRVADAQAAVLDRASALPAIDVPTAQACGRVLAEAVHARWDLPARDVSIMDGWAVRTTDLASHPDTRIELAVVGESAAGHPSAIELQPGQTTRISTGAVVPAGADAVVPREDATVQDQVVCIDLGLTGEMRPGRFVRARASDIAKDERLLRAGTLLRPGSIAAAASCGHELLRVHRQPRVAILGTGDELVAIGATPAPGQVVSSNGIMLAALVREAGGVPVDLGDVGDQEAPLEAALRRGLQADVLVTSGGISVGDHDLVHAALERLGAQTIFRGVALQPGKPTTFLQASECLAFALPGNPASTLVAFELFVRPTLRRMGGWRADPRRTVVQVRLGAPAPGNLRREHYVRARRIDDEAWPLASQLSGNLRSIADYDLLLRIPAGVRELPAGASCEALETSGP
jgi:molybdopterin molybdotransferase